MLGKEACLATLLEGPTGQWLQISVSNHSFSDSGLSRPVTHLYLLEGMKVHWHCISRGG